MAVADHFRRSLAQRHFTQAGRPLPAVTVSIGIADYPGDTQDVLQLVSLADKAMYQAKQEGRDRTVLAGPAPTLQFEKDSPSSAGTATGLTSEKSS